ncbi:MAG: hypothetical protein P4L80_12130 [Xanthobacteraceae bacterium]|nr:hypothetical protein [Xanthobacteraceae bacterium]
MEYAFRVPNTADRRVIPIVNGEAGRATLTAAKAKADGYTLLAWPEDPAGPIAAVDLPDYIPAARDPVVARLDALAASPEAEGVAPEVIAEFAAGALSIDEARAFMRGLSPTAIASQFKIESKDDTVTTPAPEQPEDTRSRRLREIRDNVSPSKASATRAFVATADDAKRERLVEIKIGGVQSRAERGDATAQAKMKEIARAEVLARAEGIPLIGALAVMGVTLT